MRCARPRVPSQSCRRRALASRRIAARSRAIGAADLRHPRGGVPARGLYGKDMAEDDVAIVDQRQRVGEHRIILGRKARDQVGADRDLGRAAFNRSIRATASARRWRRFIRVSTISSPACSDRWTWGITRFSCVSKREERVVDPVRVERREAEAFDRQRQQRLHQRRQCRAAVVAIAGKIDPGQDDLALPAYQRGACGCDNGIDAQPTAPCRARARSRRRCSYASNRSGHRGRRARGRRPRGRGVRWNRVPLQRPFCRRVGAHRRWRPCLRKIARVDKPFASLDTTRAPIAVNASRSSSAAHPVTTTSAPGRSRSARRTACRACRTASSVTAQLLKTIVSRAPAALTAARTPSPSAMFSRQPKLTTSCRSAREALIRTAPSRSRPHRRASRRRSSRSARRGASG